MESTIRKMGIEAVVFPVFLLLLLVMMAPHSWGAPNRCKGAVVNDNNPCTNDACDPATGRVSHGNNTAVCNDGNVCTENDQCRDGTCAGQPMSCPEGQECNAQGACQARAVPHAARDEVILMLQQYGGVGNYSTAGRNAKQDYDDTQMGLREKFDEDPQKVIKPIEELLNLAPGQMETEKFIAIHALGKLPLEQGAPVLKKEIEKALPEIAGGEGEEGTDVVIQALARKMAAVEALAAHDPHYLLELIENPATNKGVKRAAVEAYILTDDDKQGAVEALRGLLSQEERFMLIPFEQNSDETTIKDFFLGGGGGEEEEKPPTKGKKKK